MDVPSTSGPERVLIIGRSPTVITDAARILRGKGFLADATNQFGEVLTEYDVTEIDVVVFGGMVPAAVKQHLRDEISKVNGHVVFVQGLAGIPGLIAAQVEGAVSAAGEAVDGDGGGGGDGGDGDGGGDRGVVAYDSATRTVRLVLREPARVVVEAWWGTSFTPPEPTSTSMRVLDSSFGAGEFAVALPAEVPPVASFVTVSAGRAVHAFTVGPIPEAVRRLVPGADPARPSALPPVRAVATHTGG